jgi:hypothetical protein
MLVDEIILNIGSGRRGERVSYVEVSDSNTP